MYDTLPHDILVKAAQLRNHSKEIFVQLFLAGKPKTAQEVADMVKHKRAYVHMRLLELERLGYVISYREGKTRVFEVKR